MKKLSPAERILRVLSPRDARMTRKDICKAAKLTKDEFNEVLPEVRAKRPDIRYGKYDHTYWFANSPTWYSDHTDLTKVLPKKGMFGAISDTHLCSVAERLDVLEEAYGIYRERGVSCVLHCGDLTDGWAEYRHHINFVKVHGDQSQAKYVIDNYPKIDVPTYVIQGNHDDSFNRTKIDRISLITHGFKHEGKEVNPRSDIVYLGQYSHYLVFPEEVTVQLLHPRGGNTYAKSYRQQKRSEEMDKNTRPDAQLSGHFHTYNHLWVNHTHMLALPGMQDQTEFFVRLGYPRSIGFAIVHYEIRNGEFFSFSPELFMRP